MFARIHSYTYFILAAAALGLVLGGRYGNQLAYRQAHGANIGWANGGALPAELAEARFDPAEQRYLAVITPTGEVFVRDKSGQWVARPQAGALDAAAYYASFPDQTCSGADLSQSRLIRQPPRPPVSQVDCLLTYSPETRRYVRYILLEDNTLLYWTQEEHPGLVISSAGAYLENWFVYGLMGGGLGLATGLGVVILIEIGLWVGHWLFKHRRATHN